MYKMLICMINKTRTSLGRGAEIQSNDKKQLGVNSPKRVSSANLIFV